jgi:hypothetical protein
MSYREVLNGFECRGEDGSGRLRGQFSMRFSRLERSILLTRLVLQLISTQAMYLLSSEYARK